MNKALQFIIIWLAVLLLIGFASFHTKLGKKAQTNIALIMIVIFSWMYSYRTLGLDLKNYEEFYNAYGTSILRQLLQPGTLFTGIYEPVYTLWIYISKTIGLSFNQSTFFYVLIPFLVFFHAIKKYTKHPLVGLAVFMVIFMFYFDLTRMFFALSFALCAYMNEKKMWKLVLYAIAFCCQYTTILLLVYELIAGTKFLSKLSTMSMVIWSIVGVGVLRIISVFFNGSNNRFLFKILYYMKTEWRFSSKSQLILLVLISVYPIIMGLYFYIKYKNEPAFNNPFDQKVLATLKVASAASLVSLSFGFRVAARVMLPALAPLSICLTPFVADNVYDGKINSTALRLLFILLLYDVFMSAYYLWVAITY